MLPILGELAVQGGHGRLHGQDRVKQLFPGKGGVRTLTPEIDKSRHCTDDSGHTPWQCKITLKGQLQTGGSQVPWTCKDLNYVYFGMV